MDIYGLFDSQDQAKKQFALRQTVHTLDLKTTFRLRYEMGGRTGYTVGTLEDVLSMITFADEMQKSVFFAALREELEKPFCSGHTGPVGVCSTCTVLYGPTGTYFS